MLERQVKTVLDAGVAAITASTDGVLNHFLLNYDLTREQALHAQQVFSATPPTISLGYSVLNFDRLPLVSVMVGGEDEGVWGLNDNVGVLDAVDALAFQAEGIDASVGDELKGSFWSTQIILQIESLSYDVTSYLYQLCKDFLVIGREYMAGQGMMNPKLKGRELAPQLIDGEYIFSRNLQVNFQALFSVNTGRNPRAAHSGLGDVLLRELSRRSRPAVGEFPGVTDELYGTNPQVTTYTEGDDE